MANSNTFFYRLVFTGLLLFAIPVIVLAKKEVNSAVEVSVILLMNETFIQDSILKAKPAEKKSEEVKPDTKKPDIKAVPKSRPKLKPRGVTDKIKIKPVKIPRPKIIKRTISPILRLK